MKFLATICFIGCIAAVHIKNSYIDDYIPNGLILVHHNDIFLAHEHKQLRFTLNLNSYFRHTEILRNRTEHITNLCEELNDPTTCFQFTQFLNKETRNFINEHSQIKQNKIRQDDYIPEKLFIMVQQYIQSFMNIKNNKIVSIDNDDSNLIINSNASTNSDIVEKAITIEFAEILSNLNMRLVDAKKSSNTEFLNDVIQFITISFFDFSRVTDSILNILEDGKQSTVLHLIGINNFVETLSELKDSQQFFPSSSDEINPIEVLKISTTDIQLCNHLIIIDIKVPISSTRQTLFKLFRIPYKKRGERNIMIKKSKEFFVNNTKNYFTFNEQELSKCNRLLNNHFVCSVDQGKFNRKSCEGEILSHKNDSICSLTPVKPRSHLIHLLNGTFYAVVYDPLTIELTYKNDTKQKQTFNSDGWLEVEIGSSIAIEKQRMTISNETKDCNSKTYSQIDNLPNLNHSESSNETKIIDNHVKPSNNIENIVKVRNLISLEVFWIAVTTVITCLILTCLIVYLIWKCVCCC